MPAPRPPCTVARGAGPVAVPRWSAFAASESPSPADGYAPGLFVLKRAADLKARVSAAEPRVRALISPEGFLRRYPIEGGSVRKLASAASTVAYYITTVNELQSRDEADH